MTRSEVRLRTPAKVNPVLEVLQKRADGYHDLDLVFQAVSLYDELILEKIPSCVEFRVEPPLPGLADALQDTHQELHVRPRPVPAARQGCMSKYWTGIFASGKAASTFPSAPFILHSPRPRRPGPRPADDETG